MKRNKGIMPALVLAMAASTGMAQAQQQHAAPPPARQAAAAGLQPTQFLQGAESVVRMIDAGQVAEVWDGGSAVLKQAVKREAFLKQVTDIRTKLGAVSRREWVSISRQAGGQQDKLPPGEYVSVAFVSGFAKGTTREVVSFRRDQDGQWRVTGYVVN